MCSPPPDHLGRRGSCYLRNISNANVPTWNYQTWSYVPEQTWPGPQREPLSPAPQIFPSNTLVPGPVLVDTLPWVLGRPKRQVRGPARKPRAPAKRCGWRSMPHPAASIQAGRKGQALTMDKTMAGGALTLSRQSFFPFSQLPWEVDHILPQCTREETEARGHPTSRKQSWGGDPAGGAPSHAVTTEDSRLL